MARGLVWLVAVGMSTACGRIRFDPVGDGAVGGGGDGAPADRPIIDTNVVFLSGPTVSPGTLGGLAAADAICQGEATQAGLAGSYVAFLSTSTVNAIDRLGSARGWTRPDGTPFADTVADIAAGTIFSTPIVAADGTRPASSNGPRYVLTGSTSAGTVSAGGTCSDYTSMTTKIEVGTATSSASFADWGAAIPCGGGQQIYCFGIDRNVAVARPTASLPDRRAFLSAPWTPGGGLSGADNQCQTEATAAGLTGSYRALLASSSGTAAARFSISGATWMRLDGLPVAATASDLMTDTRLVEAPLNLTASGQYLGSVYVWTGSNDVFSAAGPDCNDWTSNVPGQSGYLGRPEFADPNWFYNLAPGIGSQTCNLSARLYCLEQ